MAAGGSGRCAILRDPGQAAPDAREPDLPRVRIRSNMPAMSRSDDVPALLARVTTLSLALPEARHAQWGRHADFSVRGKSFARFHDDHHGDGIVAVLCRSALGENVGRAGRDPGRFFLPSFNARHGWFGIRLVGPPVDWEDVQAALLASWRLAAPKTLVAKLDGAAPL